MITNGGNLREMYDNTKQYTTLIEVEDQYYR